MWLFRCTCVKAVGEDWSSHALKYTDMQFNNVSEFLPQQNKKGNRGKRERVRQSRESLFMTFYFLVFRVWSKCISLKTQLIEQYWLPLYLSLSSILEDKFRAFYLKNFACNQGLYILAFNSLLIIFDFSHCGCFLFVNWRCGLV